LAAWIATLSLATPAAAWNATGHRIVAAIAYDHLSWEARARVNQLMLLHPDYARLLTPDSPEDPRPRARAVFIAAAVWADQIKGDPRFYDESRADAQPTPLLPGFPGMQRHTNWHYIDIPISGDGTSGETEPPPHVLSELRRILNEIDRSPDDPVNPPYLLPWLLHLVGDVHQPLHCSSRFLKSQPTGDAGGNFVIVSPGRTLHALWDDLPGSDISDAYVTRFAAEITQEYMNRSSAERRIILDPQTWVKEGFELAQRRVYTFGPQTGSRDNPLNLPAGYEENARRVARVQLATAGFRLAAVLNDKLK
jgi:hypothetical protein